MLDEASQLRFTRRHTHTMHQVVRKPTKRSCSCIVPPSFPSLAGTGFSLLSTDCPATIVDSSPRLIIITVDSTLGIAVQTFLSLFFLLAALPMPWNSSSRHRLLLVFLLFLPPPAMPSFLSLSHRELISSVVFNPNLPNTVYFLLLLNVPRRSREH